MLRIRDAVRGLAVGAVALGFAVLPSVATAQNGPAQGPLTVEVVLTGDVGGDPGAVAFTVTRQSTGATVLAGTGTAALQTFTLDAGSYLITPSVTDSAYAITDTSCRSQAGQGPNRPDFIIDGTGQGGGGDASCVITVRYTAPATTIPDDTTTTAPPTTPPATVPATVPPATTTPADTTTTVPAATTTTVDQDALPPSGDTGSSSGGTLTGTLPSTGPTGQTPTIALAALAMLMFGTGALALARRH